MGFFEFFSDLFEPVRQKQREKWTLEGRRRGARFVMFEYDSPSRRVYPVFDKLSKTVDDALQKVLSKKQKYFVGMVDLTIQPAKK